MENYVTYFGVVMDFALEDFDGDGDIDVVVRTGWKPEFYVGWRLQYLSNNNGNLTEETLSR